MAAPTRVVLLACGSFNPITNMHLRMFEIARDHLQRVGRFQVIGGLVSPVNDAYGKKMTAFWQGRMMAARLVKNMEEYDLVPSKHRLEMCKLALQTSDWIKTSTWEIDQDCWTETAKVLTHFDSELNSSGENNQREDSGLPSVPRCTATTPPRRGVKRRRNVRTPDNSNSNAAPQGRGVKRRRNDKNQDEDGDNDVYDINANPTRVQVKLLCGADLLESFATEDLWAEEDMETIVGKHGLVVITRSGSDPEKFIYEHDMLYKHANNIHIVTEWMSNDISSTKVRRALKRNESIRYVVPDPVIKYIKTNHLYKPDNSIEVEEKK